MPTSTKIITLPTQVTPSDDIVNQILEVHANVSIAHHQVAIRQPLADLAEATIKAACNSPHTARYYRLGIGKFITLLESEYAAIWGGKKLIEQYEQGNHKATVFDYGDTPAAVLLMVDAPLLDKYRKQAKPTHYHAIRTFLSIAYRDNILTDDQARALGLTPFKARMKRHQTPVGRRLTVTEVQTLRAATNASTKAGCRDQAILDMMLYAGLRREEVATLRLSNFQQDQGRWVIVFEGKGDKPRKVFVNRSLYTSLEAWLSVYEKHLSDDAPVFVSIRKGDNIKAKAMTSQAISDLVATYGAKASLAPIKGDNRLTPHDLRRTFARRAYDCGAGLPAIQVILGHSDPKTTARYIGVGFDDAATVTDLVNYG